MQKYKNKKTGRIVTTNGKVVGKNWEPVETKTTAASETASETETTEKTTAAAEKTAAKTTAKTTKTAAKTTAKTTKTAAKSTKA